MNIEDCRNPTLVVDLWPMSTFWPFDLKNNRLLPCDKLYHMLKSPEDRFKIVTCMWQKQQTNNNKIDWPIYSTWKIFDFASNKQTERGESITSFTFGGGDNSESGVFVYMMYFLMLLVRITSTVQPYWDHLPILASVLQFPYLNPFA